MNKLSVIKNKNWKVNESKIKKKPNTFCHKIFNFHYILVWCQHASKSRPRRRSPRWANACLSQEYNHYLWMQIAFFPLHERKYSNSHRAVRPNCLRCRIVQEAFVCVYVCNQQYSKSYLRSCRCRASSRKTFVLKIFSSLFTVVVSKVNREGHFIFEQKQK